MRPIHLNRELLSKQANRRRNRIDGLIGAGIILAAICIGVLVVALSIAWVASF